MKHFFILGSNPTLSLAEIYTCLGGQAVYQLFDKDCLVVETSNVVAARLINRLGGTIKIGQIVGSAKTAGVLAVIQGACRPTPGKKFFFGFSTFGKIGAVKAVAMPLKKALQAEGVNSRWVVSKEKNLSSAAVEQSGLLKNGQEFILIKDKEKVLVGVTEAIQPFKDWSFRDYGRPERDDYSGLLPPKLARIMINLVRPQIHDSLLDPFCGSGTVLTEAAFLGCRNLIGGDLSLAALENSKANLAWFKNKYSHLDFTCKLYHCDARQLDEIVPPASISRVVTEPYLGPARANNQLKTIKELTGLYNTFLLNVDKILQPDGRVVMVWPVFLDGVRKRFLQLQLGNFRIIKPLPEILALGNIKLTPRKTIVYGRIGQKVWREIVILAKK